MKNTLQHLGALGFVFLAMGCFEEEDSCNIKTDGIFVEYEVIENGDEANAKVTFWVGNSPGGTYLTLGECGDEIRVNGVKLAEGDDYPVSYVASIESASTYDFVFRREGERQYVSTVAAPPPMILVESPESEKGVSRSTDIHLRWEKGSSSNEVEIDVEAQCLYDYSTETEDDGSFTIEAGELETFDGDEDVTCDATLIVRRWISGELDPDLKGTIRGFAEARRTFRSTP